MQEFIMMVSARLGVGERTARAATGGLLSFVREQVAGKDFGELLGALPGAADMLGEMPIEQAGGGGLRRGGLWETMSGKAVAAMRIDEMVSGPELAGLLKGLGLTGNQVGSIISMFGQFTKEKAGSELFGRIAGQVPEIERLVG